MDMCRYGNRCWYPWFPSCLDTLFKEVNYFILIRTKNIPGHWCAYKEFWKLSNHPKYFITDCVINDIFGCKDECRYWHYIKDIDRKLTLTWSSIFGLCILLTSDFFKNCFPFKRINNIYFLWNKNCTNEKSVLHSIF